MRLLNIETGILENININFLDKIQYIAISHRWLEDELELSELGFFNILGNIDLGNKLLKSIDKNHVNMDFLKTKNWGEYYILKTHNYVEKYYKLNKIIKCVQNIETFKYIWLDTLCIDKTSSTELNENINSMFNIYRMASAVHVHLCNIYINKEIKNILKDDWFTRVWTLQEYIANEKLLFYDNESNIICNKIQICQLLSEDSTLPSYLNLCRRYNEYFEIINKVSKIKDNNSELYEMLHSKIKPRYSKDVKYNIISKK